MLLLFVLVLVFVEGNGFTLPKSSIVGNFKSHRDITMHFEESVVGNTMLSVDSLKAERYLASNRFKVRQGAMAKFEKRWADRKSRLANLEGFRFFTLFRRVPAFGITYDDDFANYISFTYWEKKENFEAWRKGEAFKEAHGGGGIVDFMQLIGTALFILDGSPKPAFYDALCLERGEILNFATDNGWRNIKADGENLIDPDIFAVQIGFAIKSGSEIKFEQAFAKRENPMRGAPGFVGFSLLRRDATKADDGCNYVYHSMWTSQKAFEDWRQTDAYKQSEANKGEYTSLYEEKPKLSFYQGKLALSNPNGI